MNYYSVVKGKEKLGNETWLNHKQNIIFMYMYMPLCMCVCVFFRCLLILFSKVMQCWQNLWPIKKPLNLWMNDTRVGRWQAQRTKCQIKQVMLWGRHVLFKYQGQKIILNVCKVHKDSVWPYSRSQPKIMNVSDPEYTQQILRGLDLCLSSTGNTLSHLVYCS